MVNSRLLKVLSLHLSLVLVLLIFATNVHARLLTAEGYGSNPEAARTEALNALASSIFVHIESDSQLSEDSTGDSIFSTSTHLSTDLPLIGIEIDCYKSEPPQLCQVTMDTETASPLYRQKVNQLILDIDTQWKGLKAIEQALQHDYLLDMLTSYTEYEKYLTVFLYIQGDTAIASKPSVSRLQLNTKLSELESSVNSMNLAAKLLTKNIDQTPIYIQPPMLKNSREVTPFATALLQQLKRQLPSVSKPTEADYIFSGEYQLNNKGMTITYSLANKRGSILKTTLVELLPDAYSHYQTAPQALDFDRLLHNGYAVANDFKAELATNKGQRQLLFQQGEQIQLLVKLNKAGYFYVVGYTKNDYKEQSYLLDLNDAFGNRRFVYYVNADAANKWISLGEFAVEKPYGIESLQLISSQNDLINKLPDSRYDSHTGYHVISQNNKMTIAKTRGLIRKKQNEETASKITEAVLMFTTSP